MTMPDGGDGERLGPFPVLDAARRAESLRAALAAAPGGDELWVFAYGSLMWSPCFAYDACLPGKLDGHCRRFAIWTVLARGTPERPGLGLCLESGGEGCAGLLFRLDPEGREAGLAALWEREMLTGIYHPRWLTVAATAGPVTALTFVADRSHPQYAGARSPEETAALMAVAHGKFGSSRDYLAELVESLAQMDAPDPQLEGLLALVDAQA